MNIREAVEKLSLDVKTTKGDPGRAVTGCYISDLLSDVMANAKAGDLWVTLQTHQNIVAVASLKEMAGIVLIGGKEPEKQTVAKAEAENIPILLSQDPAFELVGRLYQMGISGRI